MAHHMAQLLAVCWGCVAFFVYLLTLASRFVGVLPGNGSQIWTPLMNPTFHYCLKIFCCVRPIGGVLQQSN